MRLSLYAMTMCMSINLSFGMKGNGLHEKDAVVQSVYDKNALFNYFLDLPAEIQALILWKYLRPIDESTNGSIDMFKRLCCLREVSRDFAKSDGRVMHAIYANIKKMAKGRSLLHSIINCGNCWSVALLLDWGANINEINLRNESPLHCAAKRGHLKIVKELIVRCANINALDHLNNTPLHIAAEHGHVAVVKELLEKGADAEVINGSGKKPMDMALGGNRGTLVEIFAKHNKKLLN